MYNNFQQVKKVIEMRKPSHLQSKAMRKHIFDHKCQEVMRDKYLPFDSSRTEPCKLNDVFMEQGTTSNLPVMAGTVLKAVQPDGTLHLRPLCTTGDLLLALSQLRDRQLFSAGVIQLPDPHKDLLEWGKGAHAKGYNVGGIFGNCQTTFRVQSSEKTYYRLDFAYRKHTKWHKMT
jgi:hypothetical protein